MVLAIVLAVTYFSGMDSTKKDEFTWNDVVVLFEENKVTYFVVEADGTLKLNALGEEGKDVAYSYRLSTNAQIEKLEAMAEANRKLENQVLKDYDFKAANQMPWFVAYIPYLLVIVFIIIMIVMMNRAAGGMGGKMNSFSRARAHQSAGDPNNTVRFSDVAGADEEKEELWEVVEFLKDPQRFIRLGARIPRGVLLVGPPGTGKTLLAKAVAGEANVPFFSISGSDFVEMYVGVGASRVRDLFDTARKSPASIIFIDEIDAVGRHRGAGLGGGHDEREQTLNQLLVEMDGFGTHQGIIVMAATNRPDVLDPALLRPGRFDRQVTVGYPDIKGREEILRVHAKGKPFEETVSFRHIAQMTIGFTGADLANLLNEAALLAARRQKSLIGPQDIEDSYMKILLGPRKKSAIRTEEDNRLTAYHEAGHALASFYAPKADPVKQITILPAGQTGGVTLMVPENDKLYHSKNQMLDDIVVSLGGRVAEEIIFGDVSTGASSDIQHATRVATDMVTRYGMSEKLGTVLYGSEHSSDAVFLGRDFNTSRNFSEETAASIDEEVRRIISESHARCMTYVADHRDKLDLVAAYLLKHETMEGETFRAAMERDAVTMEELEAIDAERERRSEEENRVAAEKKAAEEAQKAAEQPNDGRSDAERELFSQLGIDPNGNGEKPQEPKNDDRNDPNSPNFWKL
ncbi:MAG: ATP-dependent zinc metalloprotease FtsH [Clostridia bacterium]|nr:ATP-dependent zinc metalloprotease FtsH [Clostridia bacterium]